MDVFKAAEYLFGPMRSSTDEELKLEHDMIMRNSKPFGVNAFEMYEDEESGEELSHTNDNLLDDGDQYE